VALHLQSAANMEKITFGDNIPGYVYGPEDAPGVVMLQVCRSTCTLQGGAL
jgi:hypothetical protein